MADDKQLPPALQCVDTDSQPAGAVAAWSQRFGRYGIMHPDNGGHWADKAELEVDGWATLQPAV
jgi:hypothetical protein